MKRKSIAVVILLSICGVWNFTWAEEPTLPRQSSSAQAVTQLLEQVIHIGTLRQEHQAQQEKAQTSIDRYKSLKQKISNAENEAEKAEIEGELKKVISDIVKIYPEAASEIDVFGIPVDVDIEYVERAYKVRDEMFEFKMKEEDEKMKALARSTGERREEELKEAEVLRQKIREETERLERLMELRKQMKAAGSIQELMELKKQQDRLMPADEIKNE